MFLKIYNHQLHTVNETVITGAVYNMFVLYLIILFNLIIPTFLSLVGGTLSGNGCGSPNHI